MHSIKQMLSGGATLTEEEQDHFQDNPINDECTWLLKECSRNKAELLLADKKDGTFLIRPSRTGQFALSIM